MSEMIIRLRKLADHIHSMDSGSPDAKLLYDAADRLHLLDTPSFLAVLAARMNQIAEGFDAAHDDKHDRGELALAAACYALAVTDHTDKSLIYESIWPFERKWFKPKGKRHNLGIAGAFIGTELDRLQRIDEMDIS